MIRGTWVWDEELERLVPKDEYRRKQPKKERGDFPAPMISTGQMEDTWNPTDGKYYSNTRNYEKAIPKGNHILEKGEEGRSPMNKEYTPDYKGITESIATAYEQIEVGNGAKDDYRSEKEFGSIE